jgi:predicted RNA binding protein YcfA (HicA-like mRNA interferase family)
MDMHTIERIARRQGWRIERRRRSSHVTYYPPDPGRPPVVCAGTPSDWRAWRNNLCRLRKSGLVLE